jgi:O-antigen ligase
MAPRNPSTIAPSTADATQVRGLFDFDPEFAGALSETLRRVSLGLVTGLIAARAYFPSEVVSETDSGTGLVWVLSMLMAAGLAIVSFWIRGVNAIRWSWTDVAVVILVLLVAGSAATAPDRRIAINLAWEWVGLGLCYLLLRWLPRSRSETSALGGVLVATAVAVALYGLYQAVVELPALKAIYKANPEQALILAGIDPKSPAREAFEKRLLGSTEPFATFALANSLAGYLVGATVVAIGVFVENLTHRDGARKRGWIFFAAVLPILVLLICLLLTKSRSAYIALAVGSAVLAWHYRGQLKARTITISAVIVAALLTTMIVAAVAARQLDVQVLTESTKSLRYRWEYWQGAWGVITESANRFWFGWGPGNFGAAYLRHKLPVASEEIRDPHNLFLEVWAAAGVLAAIALASALGFGLWTSLRKSRAAPAPAQPPRGAPAAPRTTWLVVSGAVGGLLLVVPIGGLDPVLQPDSTMRWLMLAVGWSLALGCGLPLWRRMPVPAAALGAGALAMVVNLLAAGGIGIPAVAVSLWMLVALAQNAREDVRAGQLRPFGGRIIAFIPAMVLAALGGTFYSTVWPYWKAQGLIAQARSELVGRTPDFDAAQDFLLQASKADKYESIPHLMMAELTFSAWNDRRVRAEEAWPQIKSDLANAVAGDRNPDSREVETRRAAMAAALLERGGPLPAAIKEQLLKARVNASARVCRLYPSSAVYRAGLADALAADGKLDEALREGREALRLDRVMPHQDKKLTAESRKRLEDSLVEWARPKPAPGAAQPKPGPEGKRPGPIK